MSQRLTCVELFKKISNYNQTTGESDWICVNMFVGKYLSLKFGNGASWCRLDGNFCKNYNAVIVKKNNNIRYSWICDDKEQRKIKREIEIFRVEKNLPKSKGTAVELIKIFSVKNKETILSRNIRTDIKKILFKNPCVSCGSFNNIEIDHKNGLYNDPRVLNILTQNLDDFQPLCKHCNDQKRETYVFMKKYGKRYGASLIPALKSFGVDFTQGDESYDCTNINAMQGTYWYDPVLFFKQIQKFNQ